MIWLWVGAAGGLGAVLRFLVDSLLTTRVSERFAPPFPVGSLTVNLTGSLLAGVMAAGATRGWSGEEVRMIVAGGFLGAYTTFSTAVYEAVRHLDRGERASAVAHLLLSMIGSVTAAALGFALVR